MEYSSAIKKKTEIVPFAMTWTELESIMLTEVKSVRERPIPYGFTRVEFKKQMSKRKKERERQATKQTLNYRRQTDGHQRGGGRGDGSSR